MIKNKIAKLIDVKSIVTITSLNTIVDDLWHNIAPNTNIDDCVMKYRKLSNQNILQIYVNGSNEINISGSLELGRLPKEYRPANVGII